MTYKLIFSMLAWMMLMWMMPFRVYYDVMIINIEMFLNLRSAR